MRYLKINVNARFKEIRLMLNLSQKELANRLNITQGTVSKIEKGSMELNIETIIGLCELSKLNIDEFLKIGKRNKDLTPNLICLLNEAKKLNNYQQKKLIEFIKSIAQDK